MIAVGLAIALIAMTYVLMQAMRESELENKIRTRSRRCKCKITPICPRPSRDPIHDTCADEIPPNQAPGCDILVESPRLGKKKRFDAISTDAALGKECVWEFKVQNMSAKSDSQIRFFGTVTDIPEAESMEKITRDCNLCFNYAIADPIQYDIYDKLLGLKAMVNEYRSVEECLRAPN